MLKNEKGVALITAIILSVLALLLIGGLIYYLIYGKRVSTLEKRYTTALEAAKGGGEVVINNILEGTLKCTNTPDNAYDNSGCNSPCNSTDKQYICLSNYKCLGGDLSQNCKGGYRIDAKLLSLYTQGTTTFFTIQINSTSGDNTSEKAIIEFIYKLE